MGSAKRSVPDLLLDLDTQALDFLIQSGERNVKTFRRLGLVPTAFFEHVHDDVALAFFHHVKQGSVATRFDEGNGRASADDLVR